MKENLPAGYYAHVCLDFIAGNTDANKDFNKCTVLPTWKLTAP